MKFTNSVSILCFGLLMVAIPSPVPQQKSSNDALVCQELQNPHQNNEDVSGFSTVQDIEVGTDRKNGEQTSQEKQIRIIVDNGPKQDGWYKAYVISTILLAIIAALTLRAIHSQAEKTAEAAKATSEAARATENSVIEIGRQASIMQRQIDLTAERERPRIEISFEERPNFDPKTVSLVAYKVNCHCPTPAFIESAQITAYIDSTAIPKISFESFPIDIPSQVFKNTESVSSIVIYDLEYPASVDMQKIRANQEVVVVKGHIRYRGIHLLPSDRSYNTPFMFKWIRMEGFIPTLADSGYWQAIGGPEDNKPT